MSGKTEWRLRKGRALRCLAIAERYAMVRYKGCMVFVIGETEWSSLPRCDADGFPTNSEGHGS